MFSDESKVSLSETKCYVNVIRRGPVNIFTFECVVPQGSVTDVNDFADSLLRIHPREFVISFRSAGGIFRDLSGNVIDLEFRS